MPTDAAAHILEGSASALTDLLRAIPPDVALWHPEAAALTEPGGPCDALWNLLDGYDGIGWVVAHKIVARKRPKLLPVYDTIVKDALQPDRTQFWEPLRNTLIATDLPKRLRDLRFEGAPTVPYWLSELRVLDVIVWSLHRPEMRGQAKMPEGADNDTA